MERPEPFTDERVRDCLARILAGEPGGFDELFQAFRSMMLRIASARLGPGADAEDCVQEAFLRAARNLASYDVNRPFKGWILRILSNVVSDCLRIRWRDRLLTEDELGQVPTPEQSPSDAELHQALHASSFRAKALREALARLPEDSRRRVILYYQQGLSHADIARLMQDTSEENSRQKLRRIRLALRADLDPRLSEGSA
jgi:RNA polymerase sigma factor (sigma-70 family)